jgi:hypothetical protein
MMKPISEQPTHIVVFCAKMDLLAISKDPTTLRFTKQEHWPSCHAPETVMNALLECGEKIGFEQVRPHVHEIYASEFKQRMLRRDSELSEVFNTMSREMQSVLGPRSFDDLATAADECYSRIINGEPPAKKSKS